MPISVPNSPKVLTTKYQNWRGVDYTNDPSNVWYRRSPNGLNMLPGLDGQPFKRNGWKVELTPQDFFDAAQITGVSTLEQYKVDYFEIGGAEYLWFYTPIGCFYYADTLTFVDTSYEIDDDKPYEFSKSLTYDVGDYCMCNGTMYKCIVAISTPTSTLPSSDATHWTNSDVDGSKPFPPVNPETGDYANVDYSKSFFFEGGGRAGYYLFVDDKMFWFDGDKLHEAKPTIPVVLTMASPSGEGTLLEEVNMLTPWRAIEYVCDGSTTTYNILDGVEKIQNVYTINVDGSFTPNYNWTMQNNGELVFNPAPSETRPNQPSMRVVYSTANATIQEESTYTATYTVKVTRTTVDTVQQTYTNGAWRDGLIGYSTAEYANEKTATIPLVNAKKPVSLQADTKPVNWSSVQWEENVSAVDATVDAYGSAVVVKSKNDGKALFDKYYGVAISQGVAVGGIKTTESYVQHDSTHRTKFITTVKYVSPCVRLKYTQWNLSYAETGSQRNAFFATSKALVYGNGIINQVFLTASKFEAYSTRVWYSAATDPLYFPDTNYIEVGATDKHIMGLIKVDDYLGIIKQGSATDTSVYLAYATSFEDITTYAVKQSVNGIGAISNGAFNILNSEPLFLSAEGVMGIEPAEDESRKIRNRSYYINKSLLQEPSLESAFSFVFNGMYWLCVNNHCYVLDGSQKISWENTKTNLQYECYYLDNVPAKCFARKGGRLWFIDGLGNVCRFRDDNDGLKFVDAYDAKALSDPNKVVYKASVAPTNGAYDYSDILEIKNTYQGTRYGSTYKVAATNAYNDGRTFTITKALIDVVDCWVEYYDDDTNHVAETRGLAFTITQIEADKYRVSVPAGESAFTNIDGFTGMGVFVSFNYYNSIQQINFDDVIQYGRTFYTVSAVDETNETATVLEGCPIKAVWSTIADDDGSANYYKKLQKRGSLVAVMPMSDSGVKVYLIPDEKEPIFVGETDIGNHILPFNYYLRKKVKNYKRLQIVCENASYNDGFGIDEIIKCYTVGNYAKR